MLFVHHEMYLPRLMKQNYRSGEGITMTSVMLSGSPEKKRLMKRIFIIGIHLKVKKQKKRKEREGKYKREA